MERGVRKIKITKVYKKRINHNHNTERDRDQGTMNRM